MEVLRLILGLKGYPSIVEEIIVARRHHVCCANNVIAAIVSHLSTAGRIDPGGSKLRGERVTYEVTPHHFTLTDRGRCAITTMNAKMNPPTPR